MAFTVYILLTSANTFYIGQTNNLPRRIKEHAQKKTRASKYMKGFSSFKIIYTEEYATRSEAMKREWQLKQLPRHKKIQLIIHKDKGRSFETS